MTPTAGRAFPGLSEPNGSPANQHNGRHQLHAHASLVAFVTTSNHPLARPCKDSVGNVAAEEFASKMI
jgi:hypothetical protein